jgi:hypothetical protein
MVTDHKYMMLMINLMVLWKPPTGGFTSSDQAVFIVTSRSRRHITTDGQSASSSWCLAPFGASDQMLHLFE